MKQENIEKLMPVLDNWGLVNIKLNELRGTTFNDLAYYNSLLSIEFNLRIELFKEWKEINKEKINSNQ